MAADLFTYGYSIEKNKGMGSRQFFFAPLPPPEFNFQSEFNLQGAPPPWNLISFLIKKDIVIRVPPNRNIKKKSAVRPRNDPSSNIRQ